VEFTIGLQETVLGSSMTAPKMFFFNIITASGIIPDVEGSLLPSLEVARSEAIKDARSMMSEAMNEGIDMSGRSMQICDETGNVLLVVAFQEAISKSM